MKDWQMYQEIAHNFQHKVRFQDRQDVEHDILLRLAEVADRNGDKPFSNFAMVRVASYIVLEYWRQEKRQLTWLSLNEDTEDGEGDSIELWETLADDKAVDLDAWLDAEKWRMGCPRRLVRIGLKKVWGIPLNETERRYFNRARRKELEKRQKALL